MKCSNEESVGVYLLLLYITNRMLGWQETTSNTTAYIRLVSCREFWELRLQLLVHTHTHNIHVRKSLTQSSA